ncbi:carbonic anhydrase [Actinomadura sp. NBRC 104412]|uniref:carbonic anhydrase n=1 Tax=Actinomadura sp. NBRC 104412 TaxID=3032203 RepID=UPI0024A42A6D|nr:carbonic anhydrase [Actinomadura sp. NBRC 104412]GLZ03279.1 carbonic anhydrase [Actinomadura sp. NBRC 104412]
MRSFVEHARSFRARMAADGRHLASLARGQAPLALFISCSDSRVMPSLITGARPGELFELRTAGGIVPRYDLDRPAGETATIEFAVNALGVADIVVCGHSHCAAVTALTRRDPLPTVPALRRWLTHPAAGDPARDTHDDHEDDADHEEHEEHDQGRRQRKEQRQESVRRHVLAQLDRLRGYPCVAERLARGRIALHGWLYEVDTGAVLAHRPATGAFGPL